MRRKIAIACSILWIASTGVAAESNSQPDADEVARVYTGLTREPAQRIVSMSPAATEALFAFGAADRVVGVSDSSLWPDKASEKPRVGSILDPKIDAILGLNPDLIILTRSHALHRRPLEEAGARVETVQTDSVQRAMWMFKDLAYISETLETAEPLIEGLIERSNDLIRQAREKPPKRVLISLIHEEDSLEEILVLTRDNYLDELVAFANGQNVVPDDPTLALLTMPMTAEEARASNPDVVIDLAQSELTESARENLKEMWSDLFESADASPQIIVAHDPYLGTPGVRMDQSLKKLIRWIHGETE